MGYYRGCVPPLFGSVIYRSVQFSVYEAIYTKSENIPSLRDTLPGMTTERRVLLGGIIAGTARSLLENPFEYAKVKRQTG